MSITGPPGAPSKTGVALVDVLAGLHAVAAILAALRERERERSGQGQRVTINLLHVTLASLANHATSWLDAEVASGSVGNAHASIEPFGTYPTADGELMICCGNDGQFAEFAAVIGRPDLPSDTRFALTKLA